MNKQPFYHRADGLLFTSTTGVDEQQFTEVFLRVLRNSRELKKLGILPDTIEVEANCYLEPEPGDPADLM